MSSASSSYSAYYFIVILVLIVALRLVRIVRGTKVSKARTIGYSIFYLAFSTFFVASSFLLGVPFHYAGAYVAITLAAAYWSYRFADRRISFWKGSDGGIYFKGGVVIYVIYIGGLVARLATEAILIGPAAFTFAFSPSTVASPNEILGFTITDSILMFGVGLLLGRNARVWKRLSLIMSGKESISTLPKLR